MPRQPETITPQIVPLTPEQTHLLVEASAKSNLEMAEWIAELRAISADTRRITADSRRVIAAANERIYQG